MPDTYKIEDAIMLVERVATQTQERRLRQDADYRLQRNDPYNTNVDAEGNEVGKDFRSVTSTVAGAFVRKVVAILSGAKLLVQIPYGAAQEQQRQVFDMKERFAYGLLEQANEELVRMIQPEIHEQVSWFGPNRGWLVGRWLLRNVDGGGSAVSIRPWDALNTYWQSGADGLDWACLKVRMKVADIKAEWPKSNVTGSEDDEKDVYDFYTGTRNAVFTSDNEMVKNWVWHGSPRVPVVIVPVPTQPHIWSDGIVDTEKDYGESVLATNRHLYDQISEIMSITLELLEKTREPSSMVFTNEEDTELEEDPNRRAGVHYLSREDRFMQLAPPETTKDGVQLASMVMGMLQRGDLPFSSYGDIQFALSGYAITQLNQQMLTVVGPQTRALSRWYREGLTLLVDQYVSGAFNPLTIRGQGHNQDYMQMTIQPQWLQNLPPFRVQVVAELPEDDIAKLNAANMVGTGPDPLLPRRWLLDNFIKVPDVNQIEQQLKEQAAERSNPRASNIVLAKAALEAGRPDLAQIYIDDMQMQTLQLEQAKIQLQMQMQMMPQMMMQQQMQQQGPPGMQGPMNPMGPMGPEPGGPPGLPPTVLPGNIGGGTPNAPTGLEGQFGLPRRS